jgi:hypothetical protein
VRFHATLTAAIQADASVHALCHISMPRPVCVFPNGCFENSNYAFRANSGSLVRCLRQARKALRRPSITGERRLIRKLTKAIVWTVCPAFVLCNTALSDPVTLNFAGELNEVTDTTAGSVLGDLFNVGDTFTGTFTFDDSVPDMVPGDPDFGSYRFVTPPSALSVTINGLTFSSDPNDLEIFASVQNDFSDVGSTVDAIGVFVFENKVIYPVPTGISSNMAIELQDSTGFAIDSDSLPPSIEVSSWSDWARLTILSEFSAGGPDMPGEAYAIRGNILSFAGPTQQVNVDVRLGDRLNHVNPRSKGVIPVAILGSLEFDATQVDSSTVAFGSSEASPARAGHVADFNADGFVDVLFLFRTQETGLSCSDDEARLTGMTFSGDAFSGTDSLEVVGCH